MADQPQTKRELLMRGDMGIKWSAGVGQFEEPVTPVNPTEIDGTKLPVHMYLDPSTIGPNDSLAPKKNDDNNQEEIKKIKKKKIKWYVKVPGADSHYDDMSYHTPPWDSSSSSSSGGSSPPYGATPGADSTGQASPPPTARDPSGSSYPSGPNEAPVDNVTGAMTIQPQFGGAPPASPGGTQRFNIFPQFSGNAPINPIGMRTIRKLKGVTNLVVELIVAASDPIAGGKYIQMNVHMIPLTSLLPPTQFYRSAFNLDSTWGTAWTQVLIPFNGFDPGQAFPIMFGLERRNDGASNDTPEIWIMEMIIKQVG